MEKRGNGVRTESVSWETGTLGFTEKLTHPSATLLAGWAPAVRAKRRGHCGNHWSSGPVLSENVNHSGHCGDVGHGEQGRPREHLGTVSGSAGGSLVPSAPGQAPSVGEGQGQPRPQPQGAEAARREEGTPHPHVHPGAWLTAASIPP